MYARLKYYEHAYLLVGRHLWLYSTGRGSNKFILGFLFIFIMISLFIVMAIKFKICFTKKKLHNYKLFV